MSPLDPDERALSRALRGRAEGLDPAAPLRPGDIIGLATGIRRRRRLTALASVAAAVAIAVPSALGATGAFDRGAAPAPATQDSDPSQAIDPTPDPAPALDVSDLPTGAPPRISYADARSAGGRPPSWTLHTPEGDIPLPGAVEAVSPSGDDWVITTQDEGVWRTTILDAPAFPSGDTWVVEGQHAASPGGGVVAWVTTDRTVMARSSSGETTALGTIDRPGNYLPVAIAGEDCASGGGCRVFLDRQDGMGQVVVTPGVDGVTDPPEGFLNVTITRGEMLGGYVEFRDDGTCSELHDEGRLVFETCDWSLDSFSPDGGHLFGLPAYGDGLGPTYLALIDATTGEATATWMGESVSATYFDQAWEDDEHVLLVAWQEGEWSVVRAGLDGTLEYAVPPFPGGDLDLPLLLAR